MHSVLFQNAYLLQSLGWAVVNSFWQVGFCWLLYKAITGLHKNISAVYKHNLGVTLLFFSSGWFVFTIAKTYTLLKISPDTFSFFIINNKDLELLNKALPYMAIVYIILLILYSTKFISSYFTVTHLKVKNLLKPSAEIRLFAKTTALHMGIKKNIQVWLSNKIDVPSVIGCIKPTILIPVATIIHLTPQQLEAVLLHELAHIKRNDYLLNLLQTTASIILFFNPFAALLNKYIKIERENCCDDWVLNYQYDQTVYANALLQIETLRQQNILLALAATNGKKQLLTRVKRLFITRSTSISLNNFQKIQLLGIGIILLVNFVLITPFSNTSKLNNSVVLITNDQPFIYKDAEEKSFKKNINLYSVNIKKDKLANMTSAVNKNITIKKRTTATTKNIDYSYTVINEELLSHGKENNYIISPVSDKKEESPKYYVKIEEERSGAKNNSTYYFQLSKDSGKADIKPIMFINKPAKNNTSKKLPDTSVMPGKRITT